MKNMGMLVCLRRAAIVLAVLLCPMAVAAGVSLPRFFADGMVVQRDEPVPVWGWGQPGEQVEVKMGGKTARATVGDDGTWKVRLPKMKAGGPHTMVVACQGVDVVEIKDVLVGDVFLCSGQSNMELPIRRCMDAVVKDVKGYTNKKIRYLKLPHQFNYVRPNQDVQTNGWQDITPQNCGEVSAICYFMAKELQEKHDVPVGIINSSVGGTQVQAWMPKEVLMQYEGYEKEFEQQKYVQENWVDSVRRAENKAAGEWERIMAENDRVMYEWRNEDYDFSRWMTVNMFADWSRVKVTTNDGEQVSSTVRHRNGSFWFRTTVTLPAELAGRRGVLRFGAIKDADSIFVNGHFVGNTTYEYPPRVYTVGEGILREGENEVVVHLMSQSGRAAFTEGKLYQLEVGELVFPIAKEVQMAVGCIMPPKPTSTYFVDCPTGLYNAMIAPLCDFPIKGMLWYQGESNQGHPDNYADLLQGMVTSWRQQFGRDFPVVIVQLPGYMSKHDSPVETGWTRIRHQQYLASKAISNSALVPTLDTGEFNDIHPQDKRAAGKRAAWQMNHLAYGDKSAIGGGPTPVSAQAKGDECIITFDKSTGKLIDHGQLTDFAILVNGKYQWATARITDDHTISIVLPPSITYSISMGANKKDASQSITTVRYCWDDFPTPTLFNTKGVPAPQFEIDVK